MNIFEEVKELVNVPTVARYYGIEVRRGDMAVCPFHNDRTPSMKLYGKNYHCFGCQAHGDVISLVQKLFGLKPIEAVKQINSDFGLGLDIDRPQDKQAVNRRKQELARRKSEQEKRERTHNILLAYFILLDRYKTGYAPKSPDTEPDGRYIYAVHNIERIWDMLQNENDITEQEAEKIENEYKAVAEKFGK